MLWQHPRLALVAQHAVLQACLIRYCAATPRNLPLQKITRNYKSEVNLKQTGPCHSGLHSVTVTVNKYGQSFGLCIHNLQLRAGRVWFVSAYHKLRSFANAQRGALSFFAAKGAQGLLH